MSQLRELRVPELRLPALQAASDDAPAPPPHPRTLGPARGQGLGACGPLVGPSLAAPPVAPGAGFLTLPSPGVPRRRHSWICRSV